MKRILPVLILAGLCAITVACGGGSSTNGGNSAAQNQSSVFITGEDAPSSSVVGFNVTIDSITLNNGSSTVTALSTPTAVDFGRLMGLRTLLGFNTIPQGTYNSVTFTFENSNPAPVISYVNLNTVPPSVGMLTGSFSQSTVTVPFPSGKPLMVGASGLAGLHIDFDLRDSLATDNTGQITGVINPVVTVMAVSATDAVGQITEYTGNVVSVSTSGNSFVMQGPYGFQTTIDVNAKTQYNGSNTLGSLMPNAIVSVIGTVQADGSILANCVEQITTDKAFISGRVLAVNPTSGPVQSVTMWVGEELGTSGVIPVDTVTTVNLSGVSNYDVCFFDNLLTEQVFNDASLVVGQRIFIGGNVSNGTFTPDMVSLRRQGVVGSLVSGSVNITGGTGSNLGYYQMQNDALMSYSAGGPFTVYTANLTTFENIDGLSGLASAGTPNLMSRGLVFKDPITSKPVVVAGHVRVLPAQQ
jgi:Domain of unknown function (DUF4382)/Domain of unknown function (DUF5666)